MGEKEKGIAFSAEVIKIESMRDGSPRLTLGLLETDVKVAAILWEFKLAGIPLLIHVKADTTR